MTPVEICEQTAGTPEWALKEIMRVVCVNPEFDDYTEERQSIAKILATVTSQAVVVELRIRHADNGLVVRYRLHSNSRWAEILFVGGPVTCAAAVGEWLGLNLIREKESGEL